jgi:hypothetical protein
MLRSNSRIGPRVATGTDKKSPKTKGLQDFLQTKISSRQEEPFRSSEAAAPAARRAISSSLVNAGQSEGPVGPEGPPPSEARSSNAIKHWGSGLRRIRWLTEAGGTQVPGGEGWSAVVRACSAGGYEAQIRTGDRVEFYPGVGASPRTAELCKAWV